MVDAGCQAPLPPEVPPGPRAALRRSEVVTLGRWGPWACGRGERAFSRDAHPHRRAAFPRRPHRSPVHRRRRRHHAAMGAGCRPRVDRGDGRHERYDALDRSAGPLREAPRRGAGGLPGLAASGGSHRRGWDEGCHRLLAVKPRGAHRFWRWRRQGQGSAVGGALLGPAVATSSPRPEGREARAGPLGQRSRLRGAGRACALVVRRWGPGPLPVEAEEPPPGPRDGAAGWPGCVSSSSRATRNALIPVVSIASGAMALPACRPAWPPRWPGIPWVCGARGRLAGQVSPLRTWSTGNRALSHTKRLSIDERQR